MVVRDYSDMTRKSRKQRRHLILMLMYMDQTSWTQNHRSRSELKMQNLTYWLCQHLLSRDGVTCRTFPDLDSARAHVDTLGHTPTPFLPLFRWLPIAVGLSWLSLSSLAFADLVLSEIPGPPSIVLAVVQSSFSVYVLCPPLFQFLPRLLQCLQRDRQILS